LNTICLQIDSGKEFPPPQKSDQLQGINSNYRQQLPLACLLACSSFFQFIRQ